MKERYILYISIVVSVLMVVIAIKILNKHIVSKFENEYNTNLKKVYTEFIFLFVCAICLLLQGFLICKIVDDCNITFQSQIKPLSTNIFNLFSKTEYPEEIVNVDFSLKTSADGEFSIENKQVIIPGNDKYCVIDFSEELIKEFKIDFSKNITRLLITDREYVFIIENVSYPARKINSTVWEDEKAGVKKLYMAMPLSENEELIISTDVSNIDHATQIDSIAEFIETISEKVIITDAVHLFMNGYQIDINEVMYISPLSISLQDNSFLISSSVSKNQNSNISTLYTDKVFKSWQTSTKVPEDQNGRRVYVRVVDNIRYTLFAKEENLETAIRAIQFDTYK